MRRVFYVHTLDVKAVIVMPVTTPEIKVQAVGARQPILHETPMKRIVMQLRYLKHVR